MISALKNNEENVYSEGVFIGFFFLIVGLSLVIVNNYVHNVWVIAIVAVLLSIAAILLFMVVFIAILRERGGDVLLQIWNEVVYLFLGLPMASICLLVVPISIYLLFFKGAPQDVIFFSLIFTLSLQLSSLFYSGIKLWLNNRSSGYELPVKIDKGPIEQLLYRIPSSED
ncbi:MAG: hypothetical protein KAU62_09385 [Candidatus Heimdallarchaeota archaeon]|nr:hypothetical protein [Candidatus Heimdallarchaeota archaeon]MCK4611352.1 hypothetical protein [Candidatus Heimdallarchaeota archaeon]